MATVIDRVPEEEQRRDLVRYVLKSAEPAAEPKKLDEEAAALAANQGAVLARVNTEATLNTLLSAANEAEAENAFNILFTIVRKLPAQGAEEQAAKAVQVIAANTSARQQLRLRILSNLYNFLPARSISRYTTFLAIVNYALATKLTELVLAQLKKIQERLQEWSASQEQARELYRAIRKIHQENGNTVKAHKALIKLLATYEGAPADSLSAVTKDAAEVIIEAINLPDSYQYDHLLELAAVKQLEKHAEHGATYELLRIFTADNLSAFEAFTKANGGFLESKGLSYDECKKKMQLLSLASLAADRHEIPYALIAESLHIKPEEVEHWVVAAIGAKLIDAKMDQLRRVVLVSRATQRIFTKAQWQQLHNSLNVWKDNLQNVLRVIQSAGVKVDKELAAGV